MNERELLKQALEALEAVHVVGGAESIMTPDGVIFFPPVIAAIKKALAQPEKNTLAT